MKHRRIKAKNSIWKLIVAGIVLFVVFLFINQFVKIQNKKNEISKIDEQISVEESKTHEASNESSDGNTGDSEQGNVRIYENVVR